MEWTWELAAAHTCSAFLSLLIHIGCVCVCIGTLHHSSPASVRCKRHIIDVSTKRTTLAALQKTNCRTERNWFFTLKNKRATFSASYVILSSPTEPPISLKHQQHQVWSCDPWDVIQMEPNSRGIWNSEGSTSSSGWGDSFWGWRFSPSFILWGRRGRRRTRSRLLVPALITRHEEFFLGGGKNTDGVKV